jgi:hypothetical protein
MSLAFLLAGLCIRRLRDRRRAESSERTTAAGRQDEESNTLCRFESVEGALPQMDNHCHGSWQHLRWPESVILEAALRPLYQPSGFVYVLRDAE